MNDIITQVLIAGVVAVPSASMAAGVALNKIARHEKRADEHEEFIKEAIDRLARIETKLDELKSHRR